MICDLSVWLFVRNYLDIACHKKLDVKDALKSFSLFRKVALVQNRWRKKIRGQLYGYLEKAIELVFVLLKQVL